MELSTKDIRASLHIRASAYQLSATPSASEIKKLRRSTTKNLKHFPCLLAGTEVDNMNWGFILETPRVWRYRHLKNQNVDLSLNVTVAAAVTPAYPACTNPGELTIDAAWSYLELHKEEILHKRKVINFHFKTRLIQAILAEYLDAIPNGLIAVFKTKDDDFKSGTTIQDILLYLEGRYDQLSAAEITKIMFIFAQPMQSDATAPEYYRILENCRTDLERTKEEISDATMIRTALENFEKLHWMSTNATEWKTKVRNHPTVNPDLTWEEFKTWWDTKFLEYAGEQRTLAQAGIAASGVSEDALTAFGKDVEDSNKELIINLKTELHSRDAKLALLQEQVTALQATTSPASIASQPPVSFVHSVAPPSDTTRFAALEAQIETLSKLASSTAPRRRRQERKPKWDRDTRRYSNTNYCWSHGCDIDDRHTSSTCKFKKPGHLETATLNDRKGGCDWFLALVGNPVSST